MTTGTLIALVDGSAYAESVCHHAAWLASRGGSAVTLFHVLPKQTGEAAQDLSGAIRLGARSNLMGRLSALDAERGKLAHEQGRAILEDARAILETAGITVETRLRHGDLIETITAKEDSGDLIVVGKRGETADQASGHLGSNLERIVRAAHHPVFVANRAFAPIERVLVAFDGGASSQRAVSHMATSPIFDGLEITLVQTGTPDATPELRAAQSTLQKAGRRAQIDPRPGEPENVLAEMTEAGGHDLLVMGAYGHSRIRSLLIGSTTTAMIRSCKVPVLLFR